MPGWIAFFALITVIVMALAGMISRAPEIDIPAVLGDGEILRILRNTLFQAALSTLLSIVLAIPFARALARRPRFYGRELLIRLCSLSLVIPTMVAITGIAAVFGRSGWINQALPLVGIEQRYSIYGLNGILVAHLFFNLPLAARIFLSSLESIPGETWRLASGLGLGPMSIFRLIEWPLLRSVIPGVGGLIFLLCFTSFAIVLSLGGGPKWSTLEVAIYQAIRFDFDIGRGVVLAFIQIVICLVLVSTFNRGRREFHFQHSLRSPITRPDSGRSFSRALDITMIITVAAFLLAPLLAVLLRAFNPALPRVLGSEAFSSALQSSLTIALSAAILALTLALPIAFLYQRLQDSACRRCALLLDLSSLLLLVVPPLTLGMGLFLALRNSFNLFEVGIYLVIIVNALLAVPFLLRILQPAVMASAQQVERLNRSLGIRGWTRFSMIYWPLIRRPVGFSLALAATLSLGDMGVIALFGTQDLSTLPLLIYRLFGAYRSDEAAVVAMLLGASSFMMFWVIERMAGGGARSDTA